MTEDKIKELNKSILDATHLHNKTVTYIDNLANNKTIDAIEMLINFNLN